MFKNSYSRLFLLGVSLLLSFLMSGRMIFAGDFIFLSDLGRDMLLVRDIVENRQLTLIGTHSGIGGFFHGPLWLYMLVPLYILGQGNPFFFTTIYIVIPLATVLAGYIVGKKLYSENVGLIFSFLLAISSRIWSYAPLTIGVNMVPLIFVIMFYFIINFLRGNRKSFIFAVFLNKVTK